MPTRYSGATLSIPLFEVVAKRNFLQEEILKAINDNSDIPAACLRGVSKRAKPIDHEAYFNEGNKMFGLPSVYLHSSPFVRWDVANRGLPISGMGPNQVALYPMISLRLNGTSVVPSSSNPTWVNTEKILKIAQLDAKGVLTSVNANPDIKDIDDVVMGFNTPITTQDSNHILHLMEFFKRLERIDTGTKVAAFNTNLTALQPKAPAYRPPSFIVPDDFDSDTRAEWDLLENRKIPPNATNDVIYESTNESSYINISSNDILFSIGFGAIVPKIENGYVCAVGTAISTMEIHKPKRVEVLDYTSAQPGARWADIDQSSVTYTRQITMNTYETVKIIGLQHHSIIHKKVQLMPIFLSDAVKNMATGNGFFVPLEYMSVTAADYGGSALEQKTRLGLVFAKSKYLNINALKRTKMKWYESGWFSIAIKVVGIVIAIISLQPWIAAAVVGGTALAIAVLELVITAIIMKLVAMAAVEIFGLENSLIFAAILAVVSTAVSGGTGFFDISSLDTLNLLGNVSAVTGALSSNILDAVETFTAKELNQLKEEEGEHTAEYESKLAELQEKVDMMFGKPPSSSNAWSYIDTPVFNYNESPEMFYFRTLNETPGELVYTAVERYAEIALELPLPQLNY